MEPLVRYCQRLDLGDWFVVAVAAVQLAAAVSYLAKRRWLEAFVWCGYGAVTLALVVLALRQRT